MSTARPKFIERVKSWVASEEGDNSTSQSAHSRKTNESCSCFHSDSCQMECSDTDYETSEDDDDDESCDGCASCRSSSKRRRTNHCSMSDTKDEVLLETLNRLGDRDDRCHELENKLESLTKQLQVQRDENASLKTKNNAQYEELQLRNSTVQKLESDKKMMSGVLRRNLESNGTKEKKEREDLEEQVRHLQSVHNLLASAGLYTHLHQEKQGSATISQLYRREVVRYLHKILTLKGEYKVLNKKYEDSIVQRDQLLHVRSAADNGLNSLNHENSTLKYHLSQVREQMFILESKEMGNGQTQYEHVNAREVSSMSEKCIDAYDHEIATINERIHYDDSIFASSSLTARCRFDTCMTAIKRDWRNYAYCGSTIRRDPHIIRAAISQSYLAYSLTDEQYQRDPKNALELVVKYPEGVQLLPLCLQTSPCFRDLLATCAPRALHVLKARLNEN